MKNLIAIVALFISVTALAQQGPRQERIKKMKDATPEELAEIQTKRLTLSLVLDDKQQKDIYALELASAKERKANWEERKQEKLSKEEREEMREKRRKSYAAMLDKQIAHQEKMQNILNEEQFSQWRKLKMRRHNPMANRDGKRGDRHKRQRDSNNGRK